VLKSEASEVTWKDGKDVTKKKVKKKQKHKKTNETRTIVKTIEAESLFNVFRSLTAPEKPEGDMGGDSEEEDALILDRLDEQMNFCEDIDDVLIPDGLEYYLGLNEDFGDDGLDSEGEGDDGEDDDDGDDGDDDDKHKKKGKGGKKEGGKGGAGKDGKE